MTRSSNGTSTWIHDEPPAKGGRDQGPSPVEATLGAVGACMAITAKMYARHKGWDLREVEVDVRIEGNEPGSQPVVFKRIRMTGDLTDDQRQRIASVASKCPVARLLKSEVHMEEEGQI